MINNWEESKAEFFSSERRLLIEGLKVVDKFGKIGNSEWNLLFNLYFEKFNKTKYKSHLHCGKSALFRKRYLNQDIPYNLIRLFTLLLSNCCVKGLIYQAVKSRSSLTSCCVAFDIQSCVL